MPRLSPAGLLLLLSRVAASPESVDPVADAAAVVSLSPHARLTVLTDSLFRFEVSRNRTFDDRATFSVSNRKLPVPAFAVSFPNATATVVTTAAMTITFVGSNATHSTCDVVQPNTDVNAPARSAAFPNGLNASSQSVCCAACNGDPSCVAWVYSPKEHLCWPLASYQGTIPGTADRILGGALPPSLSVVFIGPAGSPVTWTLGDDAHSDALNLNGTYSALDCYSTPMECAQEYYSRMRSGLLSLAGYSVVSDTGVGRFVPAPTAPGGLPAWWTLEQVVQTDMYLNVHGDLNYPRALAQWTSILGRPAMLPRSAFGVWWSRYWPYSQDSIVEEVLQGYANNSIPLNNLVFDMDWHQEPKDKTCESWGNWDVNTVLFPDMPTFAQQLHEHGNVTGNPLKLSVNIHPQTGIDHCDSRYKQFAAAIGFDASRNATIPCDFGNASFFDALTSIYMDADPLHLVDMWWSDYGGCGISGNNPQLWNNLALYEHQRFGRQTRGQAFSRYGGTGNHRYPHGFSGDTFQHEVALYWQVKTTQSAANVMWGYWSHDIGGFHDGKGAPGDGDPLNITGSELLLRWIQWGAVAPILRTHCDHCERRIWLFPHFEQMRDAMRLRNALVPYLYTEARAFYDTGVAPVHPLYYDAPRDENLYSTSIVEREFAFGSRVLAQPITTMTGVAGGVTHGWGVYLPQGTWANWNGTRTWTGPTTVSDTPYALSDIPLFVRGGILPLKTMESVSGNFPDPLVWALWPGAPSGTYALYEDDGDSDAYRGDEFVTTSAAFAASAQVTTLTVSAAVATGALPPAFPQSRAHVLQVRGVVAEGRTVASVTVNGTPVPTWSIVSEGNHTLAQPAGSLVVSVGLWSSWVDVVVVVHWA